MTLPLWPIVSMILGLVLYIAGEGKIGSIGKDLWWIGFFFFLWANVAVRLGYPGTVG